MQSSVAIENFFAILTLLWISIKQLFFSSSIVRAANLCAQHRRVNFTLWKRNIVYVLYILFLIGRFSFTSFFSCLFLFDSKRNYYVWWVIFSFIFYCPEPVTSIVGEPEMFINKDSTMNLTCVVRHSPEPPTAIYWTHDHEVLHFWYMTVYTCVYIVCVCACVCCANHFMPVRINYRRKRKSRK